MAITYIDPAQGALAEAIGNLGKGIGQLVFQEEIREAKIKNNPTMVQMLVPLARNAERAGTIEVLAKQFGVRNEFIEGLSKLTPTPSQAADEAFVLSGGIEASVTRDIAQAVFEGASFQEAYDANVPKLRAGALAAGHIFDEKNANLGSELIDIQIREGIPELKFKEEAARLKFGVDTFELMQQQLDSFDMSTPEGRHQAEMYALGFSNPAALTHMGLHERMNFDSVLEFANATGDKYALTHEMRADFNEAIDRYKEALEAGDEEFTKVAKNDVNTMRFIISEAMEAGAVFPIDTAEAIFDPQFFGSDFGLAEKIFVGEEVQGIASGFVEDGVEDLNQVWKVGEGDDAELVVSKTPPKGGVPFLQTLDPRSREQLTQRYPGYRAQVLQARAEANKPESTFANPERQAQANELREGVLARLQRELTPEQFTRYKAAGSWIEREKILFEGLSEYMKGILNATGPGRR